MPAVAAVRLVVLANLDRQRAQRPALGRDRDAVEGAFERALFPSTAREERFAAGHRHGYRAAALHDTAGDPLTEPATHAMRFGREPDRYRDPDFLAAGIQHEDRGAAHARVALERSEDAFQRGAKLDRAREGLADLEQGGQHAGPRGRPGGGPRELLAGHWFFAGSVSGAFLSTAGTAAGGAVVATGTGAVAAGADRSGRSMSSCTVQNHCRPPGWDPASKK